MSEILAACDKGDYEFGLSLLDRDDSAHGELISKLEASIKLRDSHAARVAILRKAALAMLAFIIIFGSGALYVINAAKEEALVAKAEEEKAKDEALVAKADEEKAKEEALVAKADEEKAKDEALAAKLEEEKAKDEALVAKADEEKAKKRSSGSQSKGRESERGCCVSPAVCRAATRTCGIRGIHFQNCSGKSEAGTK